MDETDQQLCFSYATRTDFGALDPKASLATRFTESNRAIFEKLLVRYRLYSNLSSLLFVWNRVRKNGCFFVRGCTQMTKKEKKQRLKFIRVLGQVLFKITCVVVASEGALVVVSSASVERLFSILASQIHDNQSRARSDYQTAAVLLRYNTNSRS